MVTINQDELKERIMLNNAIYAMRSIQKYCDLYPTCEGCHFRKAHLGCIFRNKTPREWDKENVEDDKTYENILNRTK